jgi:hypothetical protein
MLRTVIILLTMATPPLAMAQDMRPINDRSSFLSLIEGKELRRLGIRLNVLQDGRIKGRAMGRDVTGRWYWKDRYFCREMLWGDLELSYNCQTVRLNGNALRFTSDKGRGDFADLKLR